MHTSGRLISRTIIKNDAFDRIFCICFALNVCVSVAVMVSGSVASNHSYSFASASFAVDIIVSVGLGLGAALLCGLGGAFVGGIFGALIHGILFESILQRQLPEKPGIGLFSAWGQYGCVLGGTIGIMICPAALGNGFIEWRHYDPQGLYIGPLLGGMFGSFIGETGSTLFDKELTGD